MPTVPELTWQALSRAMEKTQTPNTFVKTTLYGNHNTNNTPFINVDAWVGGRRMAPFVTPGAGAQMVPGLSKQFKVIEAPNIRIKRPFTAENLFLSRTPGSPLNISASQQGSEIAKAIARDLRYMREQIDDTTEWLCAQSLKGTVTYNIATTHGQPGDAFTLDFGRPGAHTITLATTDQWDEPAATATKSIKSCVVDAGRLVNAAIGGDVDLCIMGATAASAFLNNQVVAQDLDKLSIRAGVLDLTTKFQGSGAKYLGRVYGVDFWEYARKVVDPWGTEIDLITPAQAHFISRSPNAEFSLEFGALVDMGVNGGGPIVGEIFSKSWLEEDPSAQMHLVASRPCPVPRRVESIVTFNVV